MEWLTVLNANRSPMDGAIDSFKWEPIFIGCSGSQFQMPTNEHWMDSLTVLNANQSTLDGVVHSLKCQALYIGRSGWQF